MLNDSNLNARHDIDEQFMQRALDLARAGIGLVSPNPAVGAVVVDARETKPEPEPTPTTA